EQAPQKSPRLSCFHQPLSKLQLFCSAAAAAAMASGTRPLLGHVCVVTGASRGIGKGIALQLSKVAAWMFWSTALSPRETSLWDQVNNAGLRGNYFCTVHAARLMVPAGRGLIVIVSSPGGLRYMFDVPYGVGKAACDRMAADCGVELRPFGVACVSLWPGLVRTELVVQQAEDVKKLFKDLPERLANKAESPEVSGKCVVALASDPRVMRHSGKVLLSPDLARLYRFKDVDGRDVYNYVSVREIFTELMPKLSLLFWFIPSFITFPKWALTLYSSKFAIYPPIQPADFKPLKKD
ncbi:Dehydrogenase/reductase SDR family member 1, partial [Ophiophagus hannah]